MANRLKAQELNQTKKTTTKIYSHGEESSGLSTAKE